MNLAGIHGTYEVGLERDGTGDFTRRRNRLLDVAAAERSGERNSVGREQSLRLGERKPAARRPVL